MKFSLPLLFSGVFALFLATEAGQQAAAQDKSGNTLQPLVKFVHAPSFQLPIDCTLGESCWVMNYVDMIPDDGKQSDPVCFERTYDGHKGTDIAIPDGASMVKGVNVLAAMDGTIKRVRDGEIDRWSTDAELEQVKTDRKECGNAILIEHSDGLETLYCHLKQKSVVVQPGQKVKTGDVIAQVGLSGLTQFPHLHFGVIWEGAVIDPFTGQTNTTACGNPKRSMWNADLDVQYQPLIIQDAEFSDTVPDLNKIEKEINKLESISNAPPLLAFWTVLLGVRENDRIILEIRDPNNKIFAQSDIKQPKTRARQFYYTGRKLSDRILSEGGYTGSVKVIRADSDGKKQEWNAVKAILVQP